MAENEDLYRDPFEGTEEPTSEETPAPEDAPEVKQLEIRRMDDKEEKTSIVDALSEELGIDVRALLLRLSESSPKGLKRGEVEDITRDQLQRGAYYSNKGMA